MLTRNGGGVGRLHVLNEATGALLNIATLSADPVDLTSPYTTLAGTRYGTDFNPVPDRLRVVSDTGSNLRINVANGLVITDGTLNPSSPTVVGAAYINSFAGATTTTLYVIDAGVDALMIQNPPNNGTLVPVGPLDVTVSDVVAFDIAEQPAPNSAFATLQVGGVLGLYSINLTSGHATSIGPVVGNPTIVGMTVGNTPDIFANGFE